MPLLMWLGTLNFVVFAAVGWILGRSPSPVFVVVCLAAMTVAARWTVDLVTRGRSQTAIHVICGTVLGTLLAIEFGYTNTTIIPAAYVIPAVIGVASGRTSIAAAYAAAGAAAFVVATLHRVTGHGLMLSSGALWQITTAVLSGWFLIGVAALVLRLYRQSVRSAYDALAERHAHAEDLAGRLSVATEHMLDMLIATLDAREPDTAAHSGRVSRMSQEIACALGVDGDELEGIRRGALLHDIGKIGVPDAVLLKPGGLDEREWDVMRGHAEAGYCLLVNVPYLAAEAELVLAHHERWDGGGYPRGLRGEQIPLGARIFSVADTYDAITSDRVYRPARSHAEAVAIIAAQAGRQFDPRVVEAFLALHEDGARATEQLEMVA